MSQQRIYIDTSVVGGYFDKEFREDTRRFFAHVLDGKISILYSDALTKEIEKAPSEVFSFFMELPDCVKVSVSLTAEIMTLAQQYIQAGVVSDRWLDDCIHVAAATVSRADAIVSWNFKHIVRLDKIKLYNQVNFSNGYGIVNIVTPKEVVFDEF